jgi:hypothetical protein
MCRQGRWTVIGAIHQGASEATWTQKTDRLPHAASRESYCAAQVEWRAAWLTGPADNPAVRSWSHKTGK